MAVYELTHNGRPGVRKGIILETDGQPNAAVGSGPNYCALASAAATAAKSVNPPIEIFTIGFGLDAASGGDPACPDTSGFWSGKTATALLASMSTGPSLGTTTCSAQENSDDDHFYCIGKTGASTDLTGIFKAAASQLAKGHSRLVKLYPIPVVTAVNPASGTYLGGTVGHDHGLVLHRRNVRQVRWRFREFHGHERHDHQGHRTAGNEGDDGGHHGLDAGGDLDGRGRGSLHLQLRA